MTDEEKRKLLAKLAHINDQIAAYVAGVTHHGHPRNEARIADLKRKQKQLKDKLGGSDDLDPVT